MFKSKKDVDLHVRDVFSKCTSENERLRLCFGIAKQYAGIKEFSSARRYLETFLGSNPVNSAEGHKFMGDILLELGDAEKALESYKLSYSVGNGKESLNRVCDLLARGYGDQETAESKKKWFDLQKLSTGNNSMNSSSFSSSPAFVTSKRVSAPPGPPKTGFTHSPYTNGNSSPLVISAPKSNGGNVDLQLRYLERRFDDGLGKILDQNSIVLEQMMRFKDEVREMAEKIDQIAATQEKLEAEIKEIRTWKCQSHVEDSSSETFTLRFGNENNCKQFKEKMEILAQLTQNSSAENPKPEQRTLDQSKTTVVEQPKPNPTVVVPLSEIFKKAEGSWNCTACYVNNIKDASNCVACGTPQPGLVKDNSTTFNAGSAAPPAQQSFNFGFPTANSSSFSFNTPTNKLDETPQKPENTETASPFTGLSLNGKFSFADIAKNNNSSFTFGTGTGNPSFSGIGGQLFSSITSKSSNGAPNASTANNTSGNAEDGDDDFVPTAEFQPVIPLPPLVEVKKGDENENTIAEYRAKLYRFNEESKEWKERGVGNIKLLQSKDDERKSRVVMWREKVGKLACNFSLFPDIKVDNYQNNPKILIWKCQDHAEDASWETFTLRFGNEDNCKVFKEEMERLAKLTQKSSGESPKAEQQTSDQLKTTGVDQTKPNQTVVPLSEIFKKAEGSWNCAACYVNNIKDASNCVACGTPQPGHEKEKSTTSDAGAALAPAQQSFSFGFPTANSSSFSFNTSNNKVDETPTKTENTETASPFTGLSLTGKFSFADIAKNNNSSFTFGTGTGTPSFSGSGGQLFSSFSSKSSNDAVDANTTNNASGNAEDGDDDFVPTAEFQPVIPLPPLVEVKKGDENENTIAEYRAKLYRFNEESKEWKERGVGNIKLLQSKDDERKSRVVMWREKVGKLACNFSLFPDIKVDNYQNNPKILIWKCQDHAEDASWETFTLRFGNEDNCKVFKEEMERLAKLTQKSSGESPKAERQNSDNTKVTEVEPSKPNQTVVVPLSEIFKKAEGSWNCTACYVNNVKDVIICVACGSPQPGHEKENSTISNSNAGAPVQTSFSFGFPASNSSSFSFNTSTNKLDEPLSKQENTETASPFTGLSLTGKFSFADIAKNNNSSFTFGTGTGTPSFSGSGGQLFSSLANKTSNDANNTSETADAGGEDDFVPTAEFQPVIPLPPLVEVKKGDENENTIVEYRAKLYRFNEDSKEWKERGVGNIKLLQSKDDPKKCRVVMWREKIGKLACNFSLFPDIKVTNYQSNPKVICWKCQDFAEDQAWQTFTARFGNEENCEDFKKKMLEYAKQDEKATTVGNSPIASEKTSCPGCAGCDPDIFKMPEHIGVVEEQLIDLPLSPDSCQERLLTISLELLDNSPANSRFSSGNAQVVPDHANLGDVNSSNNSISSFSFALKTPEKKDTNASVTSFQFNAPTFSFKPVDGNSSLFSPPTITGSVPGTTPVAGNNASPFASPFSQTGMFNNSASSPLNFNATAFQSAQTEVTGSTNDEDNENQEEDDYEDVDEEDECMFEEDAHIYIQNEADSTDSFADKGEGVIRVLYDGESYCARLVVLVDGEVITEHLVASDTSMNPAGDFTYEWDGICTYETGVAKSRIKAVFPKEDAFSSFSDIMRDSLEFAEQAGITEAILLEESYQ